MHMILNPASYTRSGGGVWFGVYTIRNKGGFHLVSITTDGAHGDSLLRFTAEGGGIDDWD